MLKVYASIFMSIIFISLRSSFRAFLKSGQLDTAYFIWMGLCVKILHLCPDQVYSVHPTHLPGPILGIFQPNY